MNKVGANIGGSRVTSLRWGSDSVPAASATGSWLRSRRWQLHQWWPLVALAWTSGSSPKMIDFLINFLMNCSLNFQKFVAGIWGIITEVLEFSNKIRSSSLFRGFCEILRRSQKLFLRNFSSISMLRINFSISCLPKRILCPRLAGSSKLKQLLPNRKSSVIRNVEIFQKMSTYYFLKRSVEI